MQQQQGGKGSSKETARDRVGAVLRGKWTLDRQMGRGRVSTFYAATYRTGQRVALELLEPEWSVDPILSSGFLRESYIANRVQHPGVVRVLDDGVTEDGALFVVTDLLEGETLDAVVQRRGKLARAEAYDLGDRLLDVIAAGHEVGVVHGDLSTLNVFLTTKGELRVLGYGVARFFAARFPEWSVGAWTTPEGRAQPGVELDVRSDLWCAGGVLYKMFTGHFLPGPNGHVRPLREIVLDASMETGEVIDRALLRAPGERWQVARMMQQAWRVAWAENDDAANTKEHTAIDPSSPATADPPEESMLRARQDSEPSSMTSPSIANPAMDDPLGQTLSSQMNFRPPSMAAILAEEAKREALAAASAGRSSMKIPVTHESQSTMTAPNMVAPLLTPAPMPVPPILSRHGSYSDTDVAMPLSVPLSSLASSSSTASLPLSPAPAPPEPAPTELSLTQLTTKQLAILGVAAFVLLCLGALVAVVLMRISHTVPGAQP